MIHFKKEYIIHPLSVIRGVASYRYTEYLKKHHPKKYIEMIWPSFTGHRISWSNPKDLNEKIQYLQFYTDTKLWSKLTDKIAVRDFVKSIGYGNTLTKIYGTWHNANDIDYEKLPQRFVLKCNHDSGSAVLVDKNKIHDFSAINEHLNSCLKRDFSLLGCEPHYHRIHPLIMAEELLPLSGGAKPPVDYKFWCFNGYVANCFVVYDRIIGSSAVFDMYQISPWKPIRDKLSEKYRNVEFKNLPKPLNLDKMVQMARDLSKGFPEVRIDLYDIDGKIYFGEMTFTSACGRMDYFTNDYLVELGNLVDLSLTK